MTPDRKRWIGLASLSAAGLAFLWPPYATRMWGAGHYQFFVFVLVVAAWLLWSRKDEIVQSRWMPNARTMFLLWLVVAAMIAFANITYSGLIGFLATILAVASGIYSIYGWGGLRRAAGVLWLLAFAVPLPLMLDQALIVKMQVLASELASRLLDGSGVIHFRQGVIIETPQKKFMTEEACSGIRSLFSSMAVVAMHGVWMRHRPWRIAINLSQTVVWVLVGNSLRIAIVVALAGSFPWLAAGWGHELLGLAVFGFILGMVASTDTALSRWISVHWMVDATSEPLETSLPEPFSSPTFPVLGIRQALVFVALSVALLVALRTGWVRQTAAMAFPSQRVSSIADPLESDFSGQYAGFMKQSFSHMKRDGSAMWAENSFVYQFNRNPLQAIVSIDRPWNHWHNLNICYSGIGWDSTPTYAIAASDSASVVLTSQHKHSELMLKRAGRYGFVIFSAMDRTGAHVPETAVVNASGFAAASRLQPKQLLASLGFERQKDDQQQTIRLPVSTIQVYADSPLPLKEDDLQLLRELFFSLREEIATGLIQQGD